MKLTAALHALRWAPAIIAVAAVATLQERSIGVVFACFVALIAAWYFSDHDDPDHLDDDLGADIDLLTVDGTDYVIPKTIPWPDDTLAQTGWILQALHAEPSRSEL